MSSKKSQQKKEKNRLKRVAGWYKPSNQKVEFYLINYRANVMIPKIKGTKVLEMGCSTGIMTQRLVKKFPTLVVIDGSKEYIDYTKKLAGTSNARFIVSLFEDFEAKEKFDDIIMANILEHVKDPIFILKKAKNWLKRDGRMHIMVPNAKSLHRRIGQKMGLIKNLDDFSENDKKIGHRRVYTKESLKKDIRKAGLRTVDYQGVFLKPFSHSQVINWDKKNFDALFEVGKELPDYCSTIYFICKKK